MKALTFLLFLAAAGLGSWAWWEHSERTRLEGELTTARAERDLFARTARTKTGLIAGMEMKEDGPRGLKDLGIPLDDEEKKEEKPAAKKPGEKDTAKGKSDVTKMMRDPSMRDMLRTQTGAQLELKYRDFFDLTGVDERQRDTVITVLKERAGRQMELGFKAMDKELSKEERETAAKELAKATEEGNARLKELLGPGYAKFEKFEKSAPEREQLKVLNGMLKDKGLTLDEATQSKLMDVMYDTRQEFKFDHDLLDVSKLAPDNLSEQTVDRYLEQNGALQQQIQSKVKAILSAEQFEQFVKAQENQQQLVQMEIQMWRQTTGSRKTTEGKD